MEKIKKWLEPTQNKIIALTLLFVTIGVAVLVLSESLAYQPVIVFKDNIVLEFGQTNNDEEQIEGIDPIILTDFIDQEKSKYDEVSFHPLSLEMTPADESFDFLRANEVGEGFKVTVYARLGEKIKEFEMTYAVEDSNYPILEGVKDIEIKVSKGEEAVFDLSLGITAFDIVDGELEVMIDDTQLDITKEGTYEVIASATDSNGNKTEETFKVTVIIEESPIIEDEPVTEENESDDKENDNNSSADDNHSNGTSRTYIQRTLS